MSDLRLRISEGDDTVEDEDGTGGEATSSASSPGIKNYKYFVANSSVRIYVSYVRKNHQQYSSEMKLFRRAWKNGVRGQKTDPRYGRNHTNEK